MNTAKKDSRFLMRDLPDDCTIEDIQYHLYVIEKVQKGIQTAEQKDAVAQLDVEKLLGKWLSK